MKKKLNAVKLVKDITRAFLMFTTLFIVLVVAGGLGCFIMWKMPNLDGVFIALRGILAGAFIMTFQGIGYMWDTYQEDVEE